MTVNGWAPTMKNISSVSHPHIDQHRAMKAAKTTYRIALALLCGLAVSLKAQNLYVSTGRPTIGSVAEYTLSGATIKSFLPITNLNSPFGLAVSGNDLFVVNDHTIGEYTLSGAPVNTPLIPGLVFPEGIAISGTNLFVVDSHYGTVGEYTTSGATVNASLISGLDNPLGIAISGTNLFVANSGSNTICEYSTSGMAINVSLISGLNVPYGIAISGTNLFVVNFGLGGGVPGSDTIGEYSTSGATVNPSLISGLNAPAGIAIWGNDLFVANDTGIGEYTTSGATVNATLISYAGTLQEPCGIAHFRSITGHRSRRQSKRSFLPLFGIGNKLRFSKRDEPGFDQLANGDQWRADHWHFGYQHFACWCSSVPCLARLNFDGAVEVERGGRRQRLLACGAVAFYAFNNSSAICTAFRAAPLSN